jgi:hypothetical protein
MFETNLLFMKRGQSATEQLITYGWAGMIIVVVAGVLLYLGVFNSAGYVQERCVFQNGFFCVGHRIYTDTGGNTYVNFEIQNKFPKKVSITSFLCSAEPANPATGYPNRPFTLYAATLYPEGTSKIPDFTLRCYGKDGGLTSTKGSSYEGLVYVNYTEIGGGFGALDPGSRIKMANIAGRIN